VTLANGTSFTIPTNIRSILTATSSDAAVTAMATGLFHAYFTYQAFKPLLPTTYNYQEGIVKVIQNSDLFYNKATTADELKGLSSLFKLLFNWDYTPEQILARIGAAIGADNTCSDCLGDSKITTDPVPICKECKTISTGCKTCSSTTTCTGCIDGYFGTPPCTACHPECKTCSAAGNG